MDANQTASKRGGRLLTNVVVAAMLVLVSGVMWILIDQNRMMRAALANGSAAASDRLSPGDLLPDVEASTLSGSPVALRQHVAGKGITVIGVFNTTCEFCKETVPFWQELRNDLDEPGLSFIGISTHPVEETQRYLTERNLDWPVVSLNGSERQLRLAGVPMTVAITSRGHVLRVWPGALDEARLREILDYVAEAGSPLGSQVSHEER